MNEWINDDLMNILIESTNANRIIIVAAFIISPLCDNNIVIVVVVVAYPFNTFYF